MKNIQHAHNMIALEALQVGLPITLGSPTFIKVKGIARAISQWAGEKVRPELRVLPVIYSGIVKDLEQSNFNDLSSINITVPRGLKGDLNAYIEGVFDSFMIVENLSKDVLIPFSTWLSLRLVSPGSLNDVSSVKDLKNYTEVPVSKAQAILSQFVDPNSRVEKLPMGKVYPSISMMKVSWDNINALVTRYLETNPAKILKQVNEISGKIDRLINLIEDMPEDQVKLSAQATTVLSGICAQMAQAVDLYGQIGVLARELAVCGTRQTDELKTPAKTSRVKGLNMALESLDLGGGLTLSFDGHVVDYENLLNIIDREPQQRVPMEHLNWVIEDGLTEAVVESNMSGWDNKTVYIVKIDDCYFPVANMNVISAAAAAGHQSVPAVVCEHATIVKALATRG